MRKIRTLFVRLALASLVTVGARAMAQESNWELAGKYQNIHRFDTLFTAQDVRDRLSTDAGIDQAIAWCKQTGVKHVFVETFRDGYQAKAEAISNAKRRMAEAGMEVSGCVTTTGVGKKSTGWPSGCCFTDVPTQKQLKSIFEFAAGLFDEIMIDDFLYTDCACPECDKARQDKTVNIEGKTFAVTGTTWEEYREKLMVELSRCEILGAAKAVNPKAKVIIKFPQWYDDFQERGYVVDTQTRDYDRIWVGTETRDYANKDWGSVPQYEGYFIMRWLGGVGGAKCGGGWFDWLGTSENTYVEQARQTILGGARESFLFCYGGLQGQGGAKDVEALRSSVPELLEVAKQVANRTMIGVAAYRPISSHGVNEKKVYDFVGMLGIPLLPCHEFPTDAQAAFFPVQSLKDPDLTSKLTKFIATGKPVLITDGLAAKLPATVDLKRSNVRILEVKGKPASLFNLTQEMIDSLRGPLVGALKQTFSAPNKVGLYLFSDGSWVVENFNDSAVQVTLAGKGMEIPARGWKMVWK